ncbi:MAG TPA: hypothetical protein VGO91_20290 [Pyrinomonadaceae bacterium]|jgi:hypothetical protein|nr:hypothetical protein [Pyrinomonadaceae bacterium]
MNESRGLSRRVNLGERGGTRLKFLLIMALILGVGYVCYQSIPVVYQYSLYKQAMQDTLDKASMTGQSTGWVKEQLQANAKEYGVPENAEITPDKINGRMQVRVKFIRPINFPGYTYQYDFDHTAKSTELFSPAK